MSKKKKKTDPQHKPSNIRRITCVECPKEPFLIVRQERCKACEHHEQGYCNFIAPSQPITIVSHGTPMKFNRAMFQNASRDIANSTRNYYLLTNIMQDVRDITGYTGYKKMKDKFLSGGFKKQVGEAAHKIVTGLSPSIYLTPTDSDNPDMLVGGKSYAISKDNGKIEGEWEVLYYMYDMLNLDGFADLRVNGRWMKVRLSPIVESKESYVLARQGDKLVIGRIKT
jgi:hypothetical protein